MALLNNSRRDNGPLVFLAPRSTEIKDGKEVELARPHFEVSRVNEEGKIAKTGETASIVTGNLVKIDFKEREYKGNKSKHVILYVADPEAKETYSLDLYHNIASRSLFNAMLSLTSPKAIGISIYKSKKGYMSYGLEQGGQNLKWKVELNDLPKPDVITDKKGTVVKTDYSETDNFFEEKLRALSASFFNNGSQAQSSEETQPVKQVAPAAKQEVPDSDIPF